MDALPVIDLSRVVGGDDGAGLEELRLVSHDVGFFFLRGHGVDPALTAGILGVAREFFALPEADKLAVENVHSPQFRGYTRVGGELTGGAVDWREQIDIGVERPVPTLTGDDPPYRVLEGPNLWPDALPVLRPVVEQWFAEMSRVGITLLRAWAAALGSPSGVFDEAFADPFSLLKIVRYPGAEDAGQGVGAHRDTGVLTLLLVEPGKGGLQVEHDGRWIDATGIEGTFVVNIGEMLEKATGGYLLATRHRVASPPPGSDRISVPFFFSPALDSRLPQLALPQDLAGRARGVSPDAQDDPILDVYGDNVLRYRLRAHPNVAERHHAALLGGADQGPSSAGGTTATPSRLP